MIYISEVPSAAYTYISYLRLSIVIGNCDRLKTFCAIYEFLCHDS
jgi:hypothetical protein